MANIAKRLYRVSERFPPGKREYRSIREQGKEPPVGATDEMIRSWDALSSWDTAERAQQAARRKISARWIVRYDIPEGSGIRFWPSIEPGHYDISATYEQLHQCLAEDFKEAVPKRSPAI